MMTTMPAAQRRTPFPILEVIGIGMILIAAVLVMTQLSAFSEVRQRMPASLTMAGVAVSGLDRQDAQAAIEQVYGAPVIVRYHDQEIQLDPALIGLQVDTEAMLAEASGRGRDGTFWAGFWNYLWLRPEPETDVDLIATYNEEALRVWLGDVARRYDSPPHSAQPVLETLSFANGQPGYTLDVEASIPEVRDALFRPSNRYADLVINETDASRPGMDTLETLLVEYVQATGFQGVVSTYVIDLQTGEEMELNVDFRQGNPSHLDCQIPYASTSTMKIAIIVDFFRYLDWVPEPGSDDYKNLEETVTLSGNPSANAMLYKIGYEDFYAGADHVTAMLNELGLVNSFIVAPFDDEHEPRFYSTPALENVWAGSCVNTAPDEYMETTVKDLALLLDMIYQCSEFGGGGLTAAFPDEITQSECQMMLDLLMRNDRGVLVMAGVPEDVEVAHKHGWTYDTHGDAAIVFSPGGDYVMTVFLWADTSWLPSPISFPIIQGMSEAVFNYFNPDMVNVPRRGLLDEEIGGSP